MDGQYQAGWYEHPQYGLIKIFETEGGWVYVCYTSSGSKAISSKKDLDSWTWVASEPNENLVYDDE
ncbi:MAG: hypothetical protein KAJ60_07520 [Desulfobulbaceae bacterium]|nr:hypothetical protein [Desulfobulbaceae bacterium]MCK5340907.1 hypothetical protein [Desulfobulbaceae bacterium]MCK5404517.1 hypothetical protein [Desulfobulbaceae bacterium]